MKTRNRSLTMPLFLLVIKIPGLKNHAFQIGFLILKLSVFFSSSQARDILNGKECKDIIDGPDEKRSPLMAEKKVLKVRGRCCKMKMVTLQLTTSLCKKQLWNCHSILASMTRPHFYFF